MNKEISCFEEIINIRQTTIKQILSKLNETEIVKASMGASPEVNKLIKSIFNNIDFENEKTNIGCVRITEIEEIHNKIVNMINK